MGEEHHEHHVQPVHTAPLAAAQAMPKPSSDTFWKITTVVLIVILAVFAFRGNFGDSKATGQAVADVPNPRAAAPAPSPSIDMEALADEDAFKGDDDAPVVIVEFSDFECPFCGRFYTQTLPQLEETYLKTGKVKLVYRDFPLSFHSNAQKAAEASECADEQGKFWEMHDLLFEQGVQGGIASFKQYAQQLGLDAAEFDRCLDSGAMASEVQRDFVDGQRAQVQGTPAFFVNGQLISGAQPFQVFQQVIEAELAK